MYGLMEHLNELKRASVQKTLTNGRYYQHEPANYPQSYPQTLLRDAGSCAIFSAGGTRQFWGVPGRVGKRGFPPGVAEKRLKGVIFRDPRLQEYYAQFIPGQQEKEPCGR